MRDALLILGLSCAVGAVAVWIMIAIDVIRLRRQRREMAMRAQICPHGLAMTEECPHCAARTKEGA